MSGGNAGAGKNIVELIYKQFFIERMRFFVCSLNARLNGIINGKIFKVTKRKLRFSVVALNVMLIGERASVKLKIKLARIG